MFCKMAAYSKQKQVLKDDKVVFGHTRPVQKVSNFIFSRKNQ
jgi:hypothetical protein